MVGPMKAIKDIIKEAVKKIDLFLNPPILQPVPIKDNKRERNRR